MRENVKVAKQSGNKLTQNIDSDGNLVGVANMNTTESGLGDNVSSADIRKELFDGANIRTREGDKLTKAKQKEDKSVEMEISEKKD